MAALSSYPQASALLPVHLTNTAVSLTVLVEELVNGSLLRVEEQRGHVVVRFVRAEELTDGRVDVLAAGHL